MHTALVLAPSYAKQVADQYYMDDAVTKTLRDYVDTFGFAQKNMNAVRARLVTVIPRLLRCYRVHLHTMLQVDILIEDGKQLLQSWGAEEPDFLLVSPKICFQLTMTQERTSYLAKGDDGQDMLKEGPMLSKYRGLSIIKSRAFSMEEGAAPRDVLRRRVRTSEFYYGPYYHGAERNDRVELYDEYTDNFVSLNLQKLVSNLGDENETYIEDLAKTSIKMLILIRPAIEHYMLACIMGKGGLQHLGATLWYVTMTRF